jgi:hypothetical protein
MRIAIHGLADIMMIEGQCRFGVRWRCHIQRYVGGAQPYYAYRINILPVPNMAKVPTNLNSGVLRYCFDRVML